jgi:hypothetical protein
MNSLDEYFQFIEKNKEIIATIKDLHNKGFYTVQIAKELNLSIDFINSCKAVFLHPVKA